MTDPRPIGDGLRLVRPEPELDESDAAVAAARQEGLAAVMEANWSRIMPQRFARATLDPIPGKPNTGVADEQARRRLRVWTTQHRPPNLILLGAVGTGKSSAAVACVHPAFVACLEVMFAPVREMLEALRAEFDSSQRGMLGDLCAEDRLVLDDLGTEKETEWTMERLGMVVDRRWSEERPTIVTSNLNQKDLTTRYGAHLASRLFDGAVVVVLRGPNRRGR